MNVFPLDEIVGEPSTEAQEIWHLNDGFWKQTMQKEVETLDDGGVTGTETFRMGCENLSEEAAVCAWTLRAVKCDDVRELCAEVGLAIDQEFGSYCDALHGKISADLEATAHTGRIFVIPRRS